MKKNVFTTSYRILLPVILAIALLVPKKPGQIVILILFGLWVLFLLIHYFLAERCTNRKCSKSGSCNKAMKVFRSYPQTGRAA